MANDDITQSRSQESVRAHTEATEELESKAIAIAGQAEFKSSVFEIFALVIFTVLGAATLVDAIHDAEPWHSYPPALIAIGIAVFIWVSRRLRKRCLGLTGSLHEIVENGLRATAAQIWRVKSFLWWFVIPTAISVGINMAYNFSSRPLWVWAIQPVAVFAFWLSMMIEMQASHVRHHQSLLAIKKKLQTKSA